MEKINNADEFETFPIQRPLTYCSTIYYLHISLSGFCVRLVRRFEAVRTGVEQRARGSPARNKAALGTRRTVGQRLECLRRGPGGPTARHRRFDG